jgi:hypothetical protein
MICAPGLAFQSSGRAPDANPCRSLGDGASSLVEVRCPLKDPRSDYWYYYENCDGTFENGYCWDLLVLPPPFQGAFAEGYYGPARVEGMRVYATSISGTNEDDIDLYVWGNGINGPGCVLAMMPSLLEDVPRWPLFGEYDFTLPQTPVSAEFYVGLWDNPAGGGCPRSWFIGSDENGSGGNPWTYIPEDSGYPAGWSHPRDVFPACVSLGIGVYVSNSSSVSDSPDAPPVQAASWGRIKAVFD